jgi:serine/threonine protein kinase
MTPECRRQLEELYDAVKDLSPAERSLRLKEADPELRSAAEAMFAQASALEPLAWEGRASLFPPKLGIENMPLSIGDKLGHYEILSLLGKGGMGEVYKAHDPRLRRDVAIKVSAARFNERFEREAHAIAALNHPNICTLYDIGPDYLVMELVEGSAPKGPLPLDEALRFAGQIAAALEAAHEKGIVHRDLKPANVKITPGGLVKVLDFGLAKIVREASPDGSTVTMG